MNDPFSPAVPDVSVQTSYVKYYVLGGVAFLLVVIAYVMFGGSGTGTTVVDPPIRTQRDNPIVAARVSLNKSTDLNTCREALAQINQHLSKNPAVDLWHLTSAEKTAFAKLPEPERLAVWKDALQGLAKESSANQGQALAKLGEDQRDRLHKTVERELTGEIDPGKAALQKETGLEIEPLAFACSNAFRAAFLKRHFGLRDDEWAEFTPGTFTLLDAHHLELSFLMRDIALSFTRDALSPDSPPLQRAAAAFAWTVRHVRLHEAADGEVPLPPSFVVRRGQGTPVERTLVFLSLLQQFDVPGCLIALPDDRPGKSLLWTCGVLAGKDIYLFDPRMGLPVPGANGEGIATLAAVQTQPELLKQLGAGYDVTPEQAAKVQILVACPLSALAPRMRTLERVLQDTDTPAPVVAGRLGYDAAQILAQFESAVTPPGSSVKGWPPALRLLRTILPTEEGGLDKEQRWRKLAQGLIPVGNFPKELRDVGRITGIMLERFGTPFMEFLTSPDHPRDLVLRGRFNEASTQLTNIRQEIIKNKTRFEEDKELPDQVKNAIRILTDAYAQLQRLEREAQANPADTTLLEARERMDKIWKQGLAALDIFVQGHAAGPRGIEVNYQLALCKHEQAERLQLRMEEAARTGKSLPSSEADDVRRAWQNAVDWWTTYQREYGEAPTAAAARMPAARARLMLGERDAAIELLKDTSGKLSDVEKAGRLSLARQLEKK